MEASGYAATLADIFNEKVLYAEFFEDEPSPNVRFDKDTNIMQILDNGVCCIISTHKNRNGSIFVLLFDTLLKNHGIEYQS
jgi:hypothetical protein